jgi:hypothetical protein
MRLSSRRPLGARYCFRVGCGRLRRGAAHARTGRRPRAPPSDAPAPASPGRSESTGTGSQTIELVRSSGPVETPLIKGAAALRTASRVGRCSDSSMPALRAASATAAAPASKRQRATPRRGSSLRLPLIVRGSGEARIEAPAGEYRFRREANVRHASSGRPGQVTICGHKPRSGRKTDGKRASQTAPPPAHVG